jgi:MFS family permease
MAVIFLTATGFFLTAIHGPLWSLPMDLLPSRVMGYSTGFLNTGGQIAGVGSPIVMGALIQFTGHYAAGFIFMAISAGVSALLVAILRQPQITSSIPAPREPAQIFREAEGSDRTDGAPSQAGSSRQR